MYVCLCRDRIEIGQGRACVGRGGVYIPRAEYAEQSIFGRKWHACERAASCLGLWFSRLGRQAEYRQGSSES